RAAAVVRGSGAGRPRVVPARRARSRFLHRDRGDGTVRHRRPSLQRGDAVRAGGGRRGRRRRHCGPARDHPAGPGGARPAGDGPRRPPAGGGEQAPTQPGVERGRGARNGAAVHRRAGGACPSTGPERDGRGLGEWQHAARVRRGGAVATRAVRTGEGADGRRLPGAQEGAAVVAALAWESARAEGPAMPQLLSLADISLLAEETATTPRQVSTLAILEPSAAGLDYEKLLRVISERI